MEEARSARAARLAAKFFVAACTDTAELLAASRPADQVHAHEDGAANAPGGAISAQAGQPSEADIELLVKAIRDADPTGVALNTICRLAAATEAPGSNPGPAVNDDNKIALEDLESTTEITELRTADATNAHETPHETSPPMQHTVVHNKKKTGGDRPAGSANFVLNEQLKRSAPTASGLRRPVRKALADYQVR